jgi:hypothetical protein
MAFPAGAQTTVLTMTLGLADGSTERETVTITPSVPQIVSTAYNHIVEGDDIEVIPDRSTGTASVRLLNTDAATYNPSGYTYTVRRGTRAPYSISLPVSLGPTVDLADLTPVTSSPGTYEVLAPVAVVEAYADAGDAATLAAAEAYTNAHAGGGTPSSTVVAETGYGQASGAGSATAYSRGDHTHGTPALASSAPATTEGIGTAGATGTATVPARADHAHPMAAAGAPHASAVGDAGATGAAATFAASDHVHAREAFGAVTAQTGYGAASADGTATTVARSDHAHGTPAAPPSASGTVASGTSFGQASTAGVATAYSRGDHAHGTPTLPTATTSVAGVVQLDGTVGDIQALGAAAAGGTGKAADGGHVHPMPRLDQVSAPTAAVALNSQKITSLANGVTASDAAAFGQIPVAGTTAGTYAAGNDSRLSDARTPTAHKTSHATGGSDALAPSDIGALDAASMLLLSSGQGLETIPRWAAGSQSINMTSGAVRFGYFVARRSGACTGIRVPSGGTAAGATPTLVRFGLYSVDASGNLTLLSATTSDTTVFAGTFTSYSRSLAASQAVTLGSL